MADCGLARHFPRRASAVFENRAAGFVSQLNPISGLGDRGRPDRGGAHRRWWKGPWKSRRQHVLRTTGKTQRGPSTRPEALRWPYHLSKADGKSWPHREKQLHTKTTCRREQQSHKLSLRQEVR